MGQIIDITRRDIVSILRNGIVIEPFNDKYPFCWSGRVGEIAFLFVVSKFKSGKD